VRSSLARPDQLLHGHWKTPDIQVNSAGPTCSLVCRQWGANEAPLRTILEADYVFSCRSLFHSVDHAGVLGLLTHNIKNEVDQALKVQVQTWLRIKSKVSSKVYLWVPGLAED